METFFYENDDNPFFSIAIPTYGYDGKGVEFLDYNFEKLNNQVFKDFEIIVSDHSIDDTIKTICNKWGDTLNIKYYRNEPGRNRATPSRSFRAVKFILISKSGRYT